jgi:type II secretory pathway pseudopilin PulG
MSDLRRCRREAGFTMIEMLVVCAILFIATLMFVPNMIKAVNRAQLRGAAEQTRALMQRARLAALNGQGTSQVVFDYGTERIYAWVDRNNDGVVDYNERLGEVRLRPTAKLKIRLKSEKDATPEGTNAIEAWSANACGTYCTTGGWVRFNSDGTAQPGAVHFNDGYWNYIEVRIGSQASGRVDISKLDRELANTYVREMMRVDGSNQSYSWKWYNEEEAN